MQILSFFKRGGKHNSTKTGFIRSEQMRIDGEWLLKRIRPECEICRESTAHSVCEDRVKRVSQKDDTYIRLICRNCGESVALDDKEYRLIRNIVKLNNQYEAKIISDYDYETKLDKEYNRLRDRFFK